MGVLGVGLFAKKTYNAQLFIPPLLTDILSFVDTP
tara:strand:- start:3001 stop:3105 length:105 start_codon:yes stop_codon:yes gene_type:complete